MPTATFKEWNLSALEKAFGIRQVWQSDLLDAWQKMPCKISAADKKSVLKLQNVLKRGGQYWNDAELKSKFISPLIMLAEIDDMQIGYFLERPLSATVGDYRLSGIVDGMIATGFREPDIPLFCIHEYKRSLENQGAPDAQVLAAMLVAREMNPQPQPIYGMFVVGLVWQFIVLDGNHYCISKTHNADDEEIFILFKMLKNLKTIITAHLPPAND